MSDPRDGFEVIAEAGYAEYEAGFEYGIYGGKDGLWATLRYLPNSQMYRFATGTGFLGPFAEVGSEIDPYGIGSILRPPGTDTWFRYLSSFGPYDAPYFTTDFETWTQTEATGFPVAVPPEYLLRASDVQYDRERTDYWFCVTLDALSASGHVVYTSNPADTWVTSGNLIAPAPDVPGTHTGGGSPYLFTASKGDGTPTITYTYLWSDGQARQDLLLRRAPDGVGGTWSEPILLHRTSGDNVEYSVFPTGDDFWEPSAPHTLDSLISTVRDSYAVLQRPTQTSPSWWLCDSPTLDGTWTQIVRPAEFAFSYDYKLYVDSGLWYIEGTDSGDRPLLYAGELPTSLTKCDFPEISGASGSPSIYIGDDWYASVSAYDAESNWIGDYFLGPDDGIGGWD